jgi:hypothetical protein
MVLGLRIRGTGSWLGPSEITQLLAHVAIVVLVGWLVYLAVRGGRGCS